MNEDSKTRFETNHILDGLGPVGFCWSWAHTYGYRTVKFIGECFFYFGGNILNVPNFTHKFYKIIGSK